MRCWRFKPLSSLFVVLTTYSTSNSQKQVQWSTVALLKSYSNTYLDMTWKQRTNYALVSSSMWLRTLLTFSRYSVWNTVLLVVKNVKINSSKWCSVINSLLSRLQLLQLTKFGLNGCISLALTCKNLTIKRLAKGQRIDCSSVWVHFLVWALK